MTIFDWMCASTFICVALFFLLLISTRFVKSPKLALNLGDLAMFILGLGLLIGGIGLAGSALSGQANNPSQALGMSPIGIFFGIGLLAKVYIYRKQLRQLDKKWDDLTKKRPPDGKDEPPAN